MQISEPVHNTDMKIVVSECVCYDILLTISAYCDIKYIF